MDSPLSRSPGSRVLIGVGLPITRASSPLGGPHRLEYWGTPPHRRSPPLALPPPPPPLPHWPIEWDCAAPIRFWLVPGLACQLVVFAPSDWPCAKKRFTSSSPANSARMVVFPSTHLQNINGESTDVNDTVTNRAVTYISTPTTSESGSDVMRAVMSPWLPKHYFYFPKRHSVITFYQCDPATRGHDCDHWLHVTTQTQE